MGAGWHRRHRRRDADRDRVGRSPRCRPTRRSAPRSTRPAIAWSTRARSASSAAGSRRRPRASTTCASSRPSRRTSRTPRAPPCPTSPTMPRSSCCRTACARSGSPRIVGAERVIGAIVAWGASMPEPGRYERTAAGGFQIGRLVPAEIDRRSRSRRASCSRRSARSRLTQNLRGARWSKLALNCAVSALGTIAGETLGPLVRVRRYRRLALEMMTECGRGRAGRGRRSSRRSRARSISTWIALTEADRAAQRLGGADREARAAARGRPALSPDAVVDARGDRARPHAGDRLPERRGRDARQDARHRDAVQRSAIVDTVWAIAKGEAKSSREMLDKVCTGAD